jgi:hypothetical protein
LRGEDVTSIGTIAGYEKRKRILPRSSLGIVVDPKRMSCRQHQIA